MQTAGYAHYQTVTTQTASPGALLVQLYQAAIRNLGQGRLAIERNDIPAAHAHIMRAQEIIAELQRTLDRGRGGEIAAHLDALYGYMRQRLVHANVRKEAAPLDEVQGLLRQLLAAWQVAVRNAAQQQSARPAPIAASSLSTVAG